MAQKFLTKEITSKIPALRGQEKKGDNAIVYAHYFNPTGQGDWYLTELDQAENMAFGLCCIQEAELGYVDLNELSAVKVRIGLKIERDIHWTPITLAQVKKIVRGKGYTIH